MSSRNKKLSRLLRVAKLNKVSNTTYTVQRGDTLTKIIDTSLEEHYAGQEDDLGYKLLAAWRDSGTEMSLRIRAYRALIGANPRFTLVKLFSHPGWGALKSANSGDTAHSRVSGVDTKENQDPGSGRNPNWIWAGETLNVPVEKIAQILTPNVDDDGGPPADTDTGTDDGTDPDGAGGGASVPGYLVLCYDDEGVFQAGQFFYYREESLLDQINHWIQTNCSGNTALIIQPGVTNAPTDPTGDDPCGDVGEDECVVGITNPFSGEVYFCVKARRDGIGLMVTAIYVPPTGTLDQSDPGWLQFKETCETADGGVIFPTPPDIEGGGTGTDGTGTGTDGTGTDGTGTGTATSTNPAPELCNGGRVIVNCMDAAGKVNAADGDSYDNYAAALADSDMADYIQTCNATGQAVIFCTRGSEYDLDDAGPMGFDPADWILLICYKELGNGLWNIIETLLISKAEDVGEIEEQIANFQVECEQDHGGQFKSYDNRGEGLGGDDDLEGGDTGTGDTGTGTGTGDTGTGTGAGRNHIYECWCDDEKTELCTDATGPVKEEYSEETDGATPPEGALWEAFLARCKAAGGKSVTYTAPDGTKAEEVIDQDDESGVWLFECICSEPGATPEVLCAKDDYPDGFKMQIDTANIKEGDTIDAAWATFKGQCKYLGGARMARKTAPDGTEEEEIFQTGPEPAPELDGGAFEGGGPEGLLQNPTWMRERVLDLLRQTSALRYDTSIINKTTQTSRYGETNTHTPEKMRNNVSWYLRHVWADSVRDTENGCRPMASNDMNFSQSAIPNLLDAIMNHERFQGLAGSYSPVHPVNVVGVHRSGGKVVQEQHKSYRRVLMESPGREFDQGNSTWQACPPAGSPGSDDCDPAARPWDPDVFARYMLGNLYEIIGYVSTQELHRLNSQGCTINKSQFGKIFQDMYLMDIPWTARRQRFNKESPFPEGWLPERDGRPAHGHAAQTEQGNRTFRRQDYARRRTERDGQTSREYAAEQAENQVIDSKSARDRASRLGKLSSMMPIKIDDSNRESRTGALKDFIRLSKTREGALEIILRASKGN